MKWSEIVADYFTFSRKETTGIVCLLVLIAIAVLIPTIITVSLPVPVSRIDTSWITAIRQLEVKDEPDSNHGYAQYRRESYNGFPGPEASEYNNIAPVKMFRFDPNTLSPEGWQQLGLRKKTVLTIQKYLSRGGRFRETEDLQKIYGLNKDDFERLAPYVSLPDAEKKPFSRYDTSTRHQVRANPFPTKQPPAYSSIDINIADTTAFISLPGIGAKLASRIIKFREKLGGFYAVEQVRETFGLPDSTFQKIKPYLVLTSSRINQINVNTADIGTLQSHPYIRFAIANAIISYRNQHGPFTSPESIKKVMLISDEIYQKLSPYLSVAP